MRNPANTSFLTVCLNPTMQKTLVLEKIKEGQVNRCRRQLLDASGKGINVTRVLRQLGADVTHLTQLGGFLKDEFLEKTAEANLTVEWVPSDSEIRFCYTLINKRSQTTTEIVEEGESVSKNTETKVRERFSQLADNADIIILSGSKAKGFSKTIFPDMVREAKEKDKFVILDYRGEDLKNSLPFKPDIIKPNFSEFVSTFFPEYQTDEEYSNDELLAAVTKLLTEIHAAYGSKTILTNGKNKTIIFNEGNLQVSTPQLLQSVNTIGCGDAFTSGLAWKLSRGASLKEAVAFGHICGAKNAQLLRPGVIE